MKKDITYMDQNRNFTTPDKAFYVSVNTYDDAGNVISEEFGRTAKSIQEEEALATTQPNGLQEGGPGSGFAGHSGRPGQVGGSAYGMLIGQHRDVVHDKLVRQGFGLRNYPGTESTITYNHPQLGDLSVHLNNSGYVDGVGGRAVLGKKMMKGIYHDADFKGGLMCPECDYVFKEGELFFYNIESPDTRVIVCPNCVKLAKYLAMKSFFVNKQGSTIYIDPSFDGPHDDIIRNIGEHVDLVDRQLKAVGFQEKQRLAGVSKYEFPMTGDVAKVQALGNSGDLEVVFIDRIGQEKGHINTFGGLKEYLNEWYTPKQQYARNLKAKYNH